jgi:hypothetical protein
LVQFRKDTDLDHFKTIITKKADSDTVNKEIESQDSKIEKLDFNLL